MAVDYSVLSEAIFENVTGRKLSAETITEYVDGVKIPVLEWAPVTSITSITNISNDEEIDEDDYVIDFDRLIPKSNSNLFLSAHTFKIIYTAGYSALPTDIENLLNEIEDRLPAIAAKLGVNSETLGAYSWTGGSGATALEANYIHQLLQNYIRYRI